MNLNLLHPKLIGWMSKRRQIRRIELMHRASGERECCPVRRQTSFGSPPPDLWAVAPLAWTSRRSGD